MQKDHVDAVENYESFRRSVTPAISYVIMGALVTWYQFASAEHSLEFILGGFCLSFFSVLRGILSYLGARRRLNPDKYIGLLGVLIILNTLSWGWILALAASTVGLGTFPLTVAVMLLTGISSASPTSLLSLPKIQGLFYICVCVIPTSILVYRGLTEEIPLGFYTLPALLTVYVLYFFLTSLRLRKDFKLILWQAERIRQDLDAAKDIQRSLLPSTTHRYGHTDIEILYKPCEELSGDFFEIHQHKDRILFYIADVTSHGTASAQVTYLLKGIFRNITANLADEMNLARVTKQMADDYIAYKLDYAVCLVVGEYHFKDGILNYATSNFPSPVLVGKESFEILETKLNPVVDSRSYETETPFGVSSAILEKGQSVYLFTDGAYEFEEVGSERQFGIKRFAKLLMQNNFADWAEKVFERLLSFNKNKKFEDDVTIFRLTRNL